jgi:hypothetical protein
MGRHRRKHKKKGKSEADSPADSPHPVQYTGPRTEATNGLKDFQVLPTDYEPPACPYGDGNDPDFPSNNDVLGKTLRKKVKKWVRNTCNLYEKIEASDIQQGVLGDCYFLSATAAIAEENPNYIERMFLLDKKDEGWYGVRWNVNGVPTDTWVNNELPSNKKEKPVFSACKGSESWVAILEKAYAKRYGAYHKIDGGMPGDVLVDMTASPIRHIDLANGWDETIWNQMADVNTSDLKLNPVANEEGGDNKMHRISCACVLGSPFLRFCLLGLNRPIHSFMKFIHDVFYGFCNLNSCTLMIYQFLYGICNVLWLLYYRT